MATINDGIIIGGAGGAIAGITVWIVQYLHGKSRDCIHGKRVYNWLKKNTSNNAGERLRSTRAIASWNNLTEDRVRYVCSIHDNIFLSTGKKEDMWSIYDREEKSVYEERGIRTI
jgi:hypothetical protein